MKGFLFAGNNDFQNISSGTLITSSIYTGRNGGGVYLNEENLWQAFFLQTDVHSVREELKLNRPDVGWYQIRKALEARNESGDFPTVSFNAFKAAYENLTEKLRPMVYELGFLRS
ncbi:MAG: hypothetical protein LBH91_00085 [Prevotellaceae bacterium]|nr:hypothetical protein [Prevotellaceae bacterium]